MNKEQKRFHDFYMDMVIDGQKEQAEKLLQEGFKRQDEGTFDSAYFKEASKKYFEYIRLESKEKLKEAMADFSAKL